MSERRTFFADVIIPVALSQEFTYRVPFDLNDHIRPFVRVIVPFGKGKLYTALVTRIHEEVPTVYQAKYIEYILDETPLITAVQYRFWKWIANYYMAPIGDVMNAALPANFKLASETNIVLHPDFDEQRTTLDDREFLIVEALTIQETLNLKEISEIVGIKTIQPVIKQLIEKRVVLSKEEVNERFTPKTGLFVVLEPEWSTEEKLNEFLESCQGKKSMEKQEEVILKLLQAGGFTNDVSKPILRRELEEAGCSLSAINTLEKRGIVRIERLEISRLNALDQTRHHFPELSDKQSEALDGIYEQLAEKNTVFLPEVTGSG